VEHLPRFNPDLPTLEGEEIDDGQEEQSREELAEQLANLEPLHRLTTDPMWETLDRYLGLIETVEIEAILGTRDAAQTLEYRARVGLVRDLRGLPEETATKIASIRAALEDGTDE
jgi:hypothetical protein